MSNPILIYDSECIICRNFAQFAKKASDGKLDIEGFSDYKKRNTEGFDLSEDLVHLDLGDEGIISGDLVYDKVLELYPNFHTLNWLMEKLRVKPLVYAGAKKTASLFRRRCKSCR